MNQWFKSMKYSVKEPGQPRNDYCSDLNVVVIDVHPYDQVYDC